MFNKKTINVMLLLIALLVHVSVFAQKIKVPTSIPQAKKALNNLPQKKQTSSDLSSTSKSYYDKFWKDIESGELSRSIYSLESFKKQEPEFNSKEMDKALTDLKIKVVGAEEAPNVPNTSYGFGKYNSFKKCMEAGNAYCARQDLDLLKKKEPTHNTEKLEKALVELEKKQQKEHELKNVQASIRGELYSLFNNERSLRSGTPEAIDEEIATYRKITDNLLAMDLKSNPTDLDEYEKKIQDRLRHNDEINAECLDIIYFTTSEATLTEKYNELLIRQSFWEAAKRVYPNNADFTKAYKAITASIEGLATKDQRKTILAKNIAVATKKEQDEFNSRRLPDPVVQDPALEKIFKDNFIYEAKAQGYDYTFLKAVITSKDYVIIRNELTGIVLRRRRDGFIAYTKGGKCYYGNYSIFQEYVGNSFTGSFKGDFQNRKEMNCENVK